jgi:hypothetical protein
LKIITKYIIAFKFSFVLIYQLHLSLGYRSDDYQWRHAYNNAGSSQMRGSWNPGFGLPRSYPVPQEYQQRRNHYGSHQLQSRNISYYQGAQQGYPNQRVCFFKYVCYKIKLKIKIIIEENLL